MNKKLLVVAVIGLLVGCGQKVQIPPAHVGKVVGKDGYKDGVLTTSAFRLEPCMAYCDKLVTLNVSDFSTSEAMELFMPQDKLTMGFDVRLTLNINPKMYDELFTKIPPMEQEGVSKIDLKVVYTTYAQPIIRSEIRAILSAYTISNIVSSREAINIELSEKLKESITKKTPFIVKYIGLVDVKYPDLIIKAQEVAAERREQIEQELAKVAISKATLERELQEQKMKRAIEVEKAEADAQVNKILSTSMTPEYIKYRSLQVTEVLANSPNKVFVPVSMLDTLAGQVAITQ